MNQQTIDRTEKQAEIVLAGGERLTLGRPLVMGILNVTPDSFSDGGRYEKPLDALRHAEQMVAEGADIIDVGGESTRPGSDPVSEDEELARVVPVIRDIRASLDVVVSIDSYRAPVVEAALEAGASMVNDVSALRMDSAMVDVLRERAAPVVFMHMLGSPKTMQVKPSYEDCVTEISGFFAERLAFAESAGIDPSQVILDPGIGFGKRLEDNLAILVRLNEFSTLGRPILVGASRKSFINMVHAVDGPADERIGGSIAAAVVAYVNGADILRVHDVRPTLEALKLAAAVRENAQ
jgi:dihydropteroate synthase